jgi:HEPN domain-containing protein
MLLLDTNLLHHRGTKVNSFTQDELCARLEQLDRTMQVRGIPLRFRSMECFKELHGHVEDGDLRTALFDPIALWFVRRYGNNALWDQVAGRIPMLVRGEVYLLQVPFVTQDAVVKLTDQMEDLPQEIAESLTAEEFADLAPKAAAASESIHKLYNLHVDDHILESTDRELIWRALFDLEHAATSLKRSGDTQNAIFHSHAAAEKFLKVALRRAGSRQELKELRHDLPKIFRKLTEAQKRFDWLEVSIRALQSSAPSMEIRYSNVGRTLQDAITAYYAALNICGAFAGIWLFDVARGSIESKFVPGSFYIDGARRTFRCEGLVDPDKACLRLFSSTPLQSPMADLVVNTLYSCLYLEVTRTCDIQGLQAKYEFHVKNRGNPVTPEQIGLKIAAGPEGSYVTAVRNIKINPSPRKRK